MVLRALFKPTTERSLTTRPWPKSLKKCASWRSMVGRTILSHKVELRDSTRLSATSSAVNFKRTASGRRNCSIFTTVTTTEFTVLSQAVGHLLNYSWSGQIFSFSRAKSLPAHQRREAVSWRGSSRRRGRSRRRRRPPRRRRRRARASRYRAQSSWLACTGILVFLCHRIRLTNWAPHRCPSLLLSCSKPRRSRRTRCFESPPGGRIDQPSRADRRVQRLPSVRGEGLEGSMSGEVL